MGKQKPIVIVDDDDDDHFILKRVFEKIGNDRPILFFNDGRKVLEYLKATGERPFLILSDVNMPIMNGIDLKRAIDADPELRRITVPFVFFSTSAMTSLVREAFELSAQGFFIKGQNLDEMEQTLRIIFDYWSKCQYAN
jgi:CheY-like chemotaxis protein